MSKFEIFFKQYLEALLWSGMDESDDPLDYHNEIEDFNEVCLENMKKEALDFFFTSRRLWYMTPDNYDLEQHGHDFALTRNGHGAGYWDRGLGVLGVKLTAACNNYGGIDLYEHDGEVYASGYETKA